MFIGKVEKLRYEFARPKGAKDKKKRKPRGIALTAGLATLGGAYGGLSSAALDADSFLRKANSDPKGFERELDTSPKYAKQNKRIQDLNSQMEGANKIRATQEKLRLGEINEAGAKKATERIASRYGGKVGTPEQITNQIKKTQAARGNKAFVGAINKRRLAGVAAAGAGVGALYGYAIHKARQKQKKNSKK